MNYRFAGRMKRVPESFLGELFRVSAVPGVISFAGGLPASDCIDVDGIAEAARQVFAEEGRTALQYSTTDGYLPLREFIADRYQRRLGLPAAADEIQIVNGSQQSLDLAAKIFIDPGDAIGMERPGYLGAIEAFSFYEPVFHAVPLEEDGPDLAVFESVIRDNAPRLFYGIPNSQNPSGTTYSDRKRRAVAEILEGSETVFYEDDAFGELFFDGRPRMPVKRYIPEQTLISGSFSKIIAPGMRIGWIYAPAPILREFNLAKQAADLHSNLLCQAILSRYLRTHDLEWPRPKGCSGLRRALPADVRPPRRPDAGGDDAHQTGGRDVPDRRPAPGRILHGGLPRWGAGGCCGSAGGAVLRRRRR